MQIYTIKLFGKAQVLHHDTVVQGLPAKAQELLFFLIIHRERIHTRETIAACLWHDASPAQAKKYIRQTLWQLQAALGEEAMGAEPLLHLDNQWLQFNQAAPVSVDISQFEDVFHAIRNVADDALTAEAGRRALAAVDLYQAELLQGWYPDWCMVARERYFSIYLMLIDKLMHYCLFHGDFETGIALGLRALKFDYAREKTHRRLMRLYHANGDRTSALRQFEICARALYQEFSLPPTQRTVELYEQIRNGEVAPWTPAAPPVSPASLEIEGGLPRLLEELERVHQSLALLRQEVGRLASATPADGA